MLLLLFACVSIVVSLLCSLWESVLLSITPSFVQVQLNEDKKFGLRLHSFKENIDQPLAALLTLNTVAHTVGAIGVGQQASVLWSAKSPIITTLIVPAVMTLGILILSEIIPKTIGANHWKRFSRFTINSLSIIIMLLWPLVWVCQRITRSLKSKTAQKEITRHDFLALTQIGTKEGALKELEANFIQNVLYLEKYRLKDIMTPRSVMAVAPQLWTVKQLCDKKPNSPFSRIPVYSGNNIDNITGFVLWRDVLETLQRKNDEVLLRDIKRSISFKVEVQSVFSLYQELIKNREHIACVINEHGSVSGLVTMEDVMECFLGEEIVDETDEVVDLQAYSKKMGTQYLQKKTANS